MTFDNHTTSSDNTPVKYQILASATPTVTRIIPELAKEIGLNESIVLLQIAFWIETSTTEAHDGAYWTFQSVRKMRAKAFPYMGVATINRTIERLEQNEYIKTGNYNKRSGDTTRWFALNPVGLSRIQSIAIRPIGVPKQNEVFQNGTGVFQNGTTLPENTPETTSKKKEANSAINGMIGAYYAANDMQTHSQTYKNKTDKSYASDLIQANITSKQLFDYIRYLRQQPFWHGKNVSLKYVIENIHHWLKPSPPLVVTPTTETINLLDFTQGAE